MSAIDKSMLTAIAANDDEAVPVPDHVQALSFMELRQPLGSGVRYWNVDPSGNYSEDCRRGGECARELLAYVSQHPTYGNLTLLSSIVVEMAAAGVDSRGLPAHRGHIIGFMNEINRSAVAWEYVRREQQ